MHKFKRLAFYPKSDGRVIWENMASKSQNTTKITIAPKL